jgi:hypothetical protein
MGIFGWDLPPGAAGDPYAPWNEEQAVDITKYIQPPEARKGADFFWLEDGVLIAQLPFGEWVKQINLGTVNWRDNWSDEANSRAAARVAHRRYLKLAH